MSGMRAIWNDGQAVTTPDLQRMADVAAAADDLVYEALMSMTSIVEDQGGSLRRVLPLKPEVAGGRPQLLIVPGSAGLVTCAPALFVVGTAPGTGGISQVSFAARSRVPLTSMAFGANATGSPRTDLLYATVQRSTGVSAARKVKNTAGVVGSQTLTLSTEPTVTLAIAPGTTTLPGDGVGAWNVALAHVTLPAGFNPATDTVAAANIAQKWVRAMLPPTAERRVFGGELASPNAGVIVAATTTMDWGRFGGGAAMLVPFKHIADGAGTALIGGDLDLIDWRNRLVRLSLIRAASHAGVYPSAPGVSIGGASVSESSGWVYTGSTAVTVWTSARGFVVALDVSSGVGGLTLAKTSGTAASGAGGDDWLLVIEAMDRFV